MVLCFQPLIRKLGALIVIILIHFSNLTSSFYFRLLAQNDIYFGTHIILSMLIGGLFGIGFAYIVKVHKKKEEKLKDAKPGKVFNFFGISAKKSTFIISFILSYVLLIYSLTFVINETNLLFKNKMIILKAYISDIEVKQIEASWVQMKTKHDFDNINTQIKNYFDKFNIKYK